MTMSSWRYRWSSEGLDGRVADSRRSGGKSEDWKPLSDILAKKAEGDFDAAVNSSKIVNGTGPFCISETSSGSARLLR